MVVGLKEIAVDDIVDGYCLGSDVLDAKGRCLLAAGTALGAGTRALLRSRGIVAVMVQVPEGCDPAALAEQTAAITAAIDRRFRNAGDDASLMRLRDIILAWRLRSLS